jgi:RNA polymerase sigma factor (sigma-70 family)
MPAAALTLEAPLAELPPQIFESLYERHRLKVFKLCVRYGGGSSVWAEDVTHDVFLKLFEELPKLDAREDLGGWLYRVTSNLALRRLQRDRSLIERVVRLVQSAPQPSAEQLVQRREETAAALSAIEALPPKERVVMLMKLVDGTSQTEIARALGMSKGNVSKLVALGRAKLIAGGWEVGDEP